MTQVRKVLPLCYEQLMMSYTDAAFPIFCQDTCIQVYIYTKHFPLCVRVLQVLPLIPLIDHLSYSIAAIVTSRKQALPNNPLVNGAERVCWNK